MKQEKEIFDFYNELFTLLFPLEEQLGREKFKEATSHIGTWLDSECIRKQKEMGESSTGVILALEQEKDFLETLKKKIEEVVKEYKEKK